MYFYKFCLSQWQQPFMDPLDRFYWTHNMCPACDGKTGGFGLWSHDALKCEET